MKASKFCQMLKNQGFDFYTGVPCSFLKDVIYQLQTDSDVHYVSATREEEAIGIAVGAYLAGHQPAVLMQNSGLGNSMGALATLPNLYKIPLLLVVSWRGYGNRDAPEHRIIGSRIMNMLRGLGVTTTTLAERDTERKIKRITEIMHRKEVPVAILIKEGVIS